MRKEYKKYGMRYAHKPQIGYPVSGVVQVADSGGKGYLYIKFSEALVDAIGKVMPQGVCEELPCFLKVVQKPRVSGWRIYACYIGSLRGAILWETVEKPVWLKHVRRR